MTFLLHSVLLIFMIYVMLSVLLTEAKRRDRNHHKDTRYQHSRFAEYKWTDIRDIPGITDHVTYDAGFKPPGVPVDKILSNQPLYVSMTTIKPRLPYIIPTIRDLLNGTVIPTHIFVIISQDSYLYDIGVKPKDIPLELINFIGTNLVSIVYTKNYGPHRKLLPVLSKFWYQDCVIVTMDDDREADFLHTALARLLDYYIASGMEYIVGLRVRRFGFCGPPEWKLIEYSVCNWPQVDNGRTEMLVLPTGSGSILYRPKFFTDLVFDWELRELTATNDDLAFRLVTMMNNVMVVMGCCDEKHPCWLDGLSAPVGGTYYPTPAPMGLAESQKIRLWTANREKNRNGRMFMNSVMYLEDKKGFNFTKMLDSYLIRERSHCTQVGYNGYPYECALSQMCPT